MLDVLGGSGSGESPHRSDDQLELYALDRLSETEAIPIEEHLIVCEPCRHRLEEVAAFAFAMQDVLKQHPQPATASNGGWFQHLVQGWLPSGGAVPRFAVAGAFAAIVLAAGLYWGGGSRFGASTRLAQVASLQLSAMRGEMGSVPAARELDLLLTDAPSSGDPFRVELVSETGAPVWNGRPAMNSGGMEIKIARPLSAGVYFARLYDASGKLLHEYGFRITQ